MKPNQASLSIGSKLLLLFLCLSSSIVLFSCRKRDAAENLPTYYIHGLLHARPGDTTTTGLKAFGHYNPITIIKAPTKARYAAVVNDPVSGLLYRYMPAQVLATADSVVFKSIEPSHKHVVITTLTFEHY
jgi:hypothetical protein